MQGYTEEQLDQLGKDAPPPEVKRIIIRDGQQYQENLDPTGRRCGEAPLDHIVETINKTLENAKRLISNDQVAANRYASKDELMEALIEIKGAITIAYPMGLPDHEPIKDILDDTEDLSQTAASKEVFDPKSTSLWWAAKELLASKKLVDFVGKNEKTKIVVKMQKVGIQVSCDKFDFLLERTRPPCS